jgi:hypothetical protein
MIKKVVSGLLVLCALVGVFGTRPVEAQPMICGRCCGMNSWGQSIPMCPLVSPLFCGSACWCSNVPGVGEAC